MRQQAQRNGTIPSTSRLLTFHTVGVALLILLLGCVIAYIRPCRSLKVLTADELALHDGTQSPTIYLAVLGNVYDVTAGAKHYGPNGPYKKLAACDASRILATADFSCLVDCDFILDLEADDFRALARWLQLYNKKYPLIGTLIGRYYTPQGIPTPEHTTAHRALTHPDDHPHGGTHEHSHPEHAAVGGVCHDVGSKGGTHADERHADEGDTQPSVSQIRTPDGIRGCGDATRARGDAGTGAHTRMGDAGRSCDGDGGVVDVVSGIVGSAGAGAGGAAAVGGGVLADDVSVEADGNPAASAKKLHVAHSSIHHDPAHHAHHAAHSGGGVSAHHRDCGAGGDCVGHAQGPVGAADTHAQVPHDVPSQTIVRCNVKILAGGVREYWCEGGRVPRQTLELGVASQTVVERCVCVQEDLGGARQGAVQKAWTVHHHPPSSQCHLTARSLIAGLLIGSLVCCSNMYFGLQTGWISMQSLQSAMLGYGVFAALHRVVGTRPLSLAENVIVQTTSVATATMPLAAGLVGVVPALGMLTVEENPPDGPVHLTVWDLLLWSTALAFFGACFAPPLRQQTIVREQLPFPSGSATAYVIKTLHAQQGGGGHAFRASHNRGVHSAQHHHHHDDTTPDQYNDAYDDDDGERAPLVGRDPGGSEGGGYGGAPPSQGGASHGRRSPNALEVEPPSNLVGVTRSGRAYLRRHGRGGMMMMMWDEEQQGMVAVRRGWLTSSLVEESPAPPGADVSSDFRGAWHALLWSFSITATYTLVAGVVPSLKSFPVFSWLGLTTLTAWGWELTPSAGYIGQGMIMGPRTALSMLGGAVTGYGILGPLAQKAGWAPGPIFDWQTGAAGWVMWVSLSMMLTDSLTSLGSLLVQQVTHWRTQQGGVARRSVILTPPPPKDSPTPCQVPTPWWTGGLVASAVLCIAILVPMFSLPVYQPVVALVLALLVAFVAVRSLGLTDLNPVSGVGKVSQLLFGFVIAPGQVVANLVAGAIAEAGAAQAGDMMQDFKTAYLLDVCPRAQFTAMLLGSAASIVVSVGAYVLFTTAWEVPGPEFAVPSAAIWLDMARLVNGGALPPHVGPFCLGAGVIAAVLPALRSWTVFVGGGKMGGGQWDGVLRVLGTMLPSGVAFAVGMYISPRWTIPRVIGSMGEQLWRWYSPDSHSRLMLVVASGLVLGEGTAAIVLAVCKVSS